MLKWIIIITKSKVSQLITAGLFYTIKCSHLFSLTRKTCNPCPYHKLTQHDLPTRKQAVAIKRSAKNRQPIQRIRQRMAVRNKRHLATPVVVAKHVSAAAQPHQRTIHRPTTAVVVHRQTARQAPCVHRCPV
ncbi:hypothetical protein G6F58_010602 [Rhizopus delemar]|nr:hypothetical protein G6F68_016377 [Rhizopus microsporus]KAG1402211.1 hypothetical protein G6F58_010602 [Rhizopus delemar]